MQLKKEKKKRIQILCITFGKSGWVLCFPSSALFWCVFSSECSSDSGEKMVDLKCGLLGASLHDNSIIFFFVSTWIFVSLLLQPQKLYPLPPPCLILCFSNFFFFLRPAFLAIAELSEQWKLKIWPSLAQGDLHVNLWSAAWEFPACTEYTHWYHIIDITMDVAECFFWVGGR